MFVESVIKNGIQYRYMTCPMSFQCLCVFIYLHSFDVTTSFSSFTLLVDVLYKVHATFRSVFILRNCCRIFSFAKLFLNSSLLFKPVDRFVNVLDVTLYHRQPL